MRSTSSASWSFEPVGEALVELGAGCLGERVVGGVADQEVAEAVGIADRQLRPVGPDELLAHERRQLALDRRRLARRAPRPRPSETARPSTEPRSSTERSDCSSWSSRAASSALIVGGTVDLAASPSRPASPASPRGRAGSPRPSAGSARRGRARARPRRAAADQLVGLGRVEGLEQHRGRVQLAAAPAGTALEQLRPRHAQKQDRRLAATCRPRARPGRESSARPSGCRRRRPPAAAAPPPPRAACAPPRRSPPASSMRRSGRAAPPASPQRPGCRRATARPAPPKLLDDLDHRPSR